MSAKYISECFDECSYLSKVTGENKQTKISAKQHSN